MEKRNVDKHIRRNIQPRVLETERVEEKSILETLNPLTNLNRHKGISAAGVLFLAKDTGRCLFQLRNSDKRHKHTWGFWGGMIEGPSVVRAAIPRAHAMRAARRPRAARPIVS